MYLVRVLRAVVLCGGGECGLRPHARPLLALARRRRSALRLRRRQRRLRVLHLRLPQLRLQLLHLTAMKKLRIVILGFTRER
jgi:hypothetical protein